MAPPGLPIFLGGFPRVASAVPAASTLAIFGLSLREAGCAGRASRGDFIGGFARCQVQPQIPPLRFAPVGMTARWCGGRQRIGVWG
jgi:hypothetical protein